MVFGTSSRSKVTRGCSEVLRDQRSFRDPRKTFVNKDHSRIFGRASSSKVVQGASEDLRDESPFKDLCKIVEIKDHSRVFGSSSISNIIQGSFCNSLPQNTSCYFRRAILLSFGHRGLLVRINRLLQKNQHVA